MAHNVVILSNSSKLSVRQLGLFELDTVPKDIPGPFTITILFGNGEVYEQEYNYSQVRERPGIPLEEVETKTAEWYNWQSYFRYQEALQHRKKQFAAYADYCERVKDYIIETCIDLPPEDIALEDWPIIYNAALCPVVSIQEVEAAIAVNFPSDVQGDSVT